MVCFCGVDLCLGDKTGVVMVWMKGWLSGCIWEFGRWSGGNVHGIGWHGLDWGANLYNTCIWLEFLWNFEFLWE